jgi:Na+/H+ antiporter NhaD/arsenite permease-like protein
VIGTTGAAMLLIRPLLQTNAQRKHVRHTVIFFIFLVCNIGGCLLPIGDPPLLLGYLRGVPFLWTLRLAGPWAFCSVILLAVYYVWDCLAYRKETPADLAHEESAVEPLRLSGCINFLYLLGVVLAAALLTPGKHLPMLSSVIVPGGVREGVMIVLTAMSLLTTPRGIRLANRFAFAPIAEVAALFLGLFITMQAPMEILQAHGAAWGAARPWEAFWACGMLSSFLDNAPTYVIFFQAACSTAAGPGPGVLALPHGQFIGMDMLAAISLGAVFMGANTYLGNGPNFMAKAIAEEHGIKMPGFLGYILYSAAILIPLFLLVTLVFFRR